MEKIINIDGKDVKFSANASFPLIFKRQFGYDILTKLTPLIAEVLHSLDGLDLSEDLTLNTSLAGDILEGVYSLELVDLINLVWCMAKTANPEIDEPEKWLAQFDEFPLYDIGKELAGLIVPSLITKKKLKIEKVKKK